MSRVFNGTSDYLRFPTGGADPARTAISIWVKPSSLSGIRSIFGRDQSADLVRRWQFRISGGALEFIYFVGDAAFTVSLPFNDRQGVWTHVAATYDGETAFLYAGERKASVLVTATGTLDTDAANYIFGARLVAFGGPTITDYYAGEIAEAAMWSAFLDSREIAKLRRGTIPLGYRRTHLSSYWPMDGTSPEIDRAETSNRDLTVTGATFRPHALPVQRKGPAKIYSFPSAGGGVTGTASVTEADDTASGAGAVAIAGATTITEGADTASSIGAVAVAATGDATEAADTVAAAAEVAITAAGAETEAPDTNTATGTVGGGITATGNVTEADDTPTATGTVAVVASGSATEAADTATAAAQVAVTAAGAVTEAPDTNTATGTVGGGIVGAGVATEAPDTNVGTGRVEVTGVGIVTEGNDTSTSGSLPAPIRHAPTYAVISARRRTENVTPHRTVAVLRAA